MKQSYILETQYPLLFLYFEVINQYPNFVKYFKITSSQHEIISIIYKSSITLLRADL